MAVDEMVGFALEYIESRANDVLIADSNHEYQPGVVGALADMSLSDKLDLLIEPEEELEEEFGSRLMRRIVGNLISLPRSYESKTSEQTVLDWMAEEEWYKLYDLPPMCEGLKSEIVLRGLLENVCGYMDGWFDVLGGVDSVGSE